MLITSIPQYIQGITNAKVDLTANTATTVYTVPSDSRSIVKSIIVSEDSGNADSITLTITDADGNVTEITLPIGDFSF